MERSINSLVPLPVGVLWPVVQSGGDQGQKGPSCGCWVWSIGRQIGPEYPKWSGCQSQGRRVPTRVAICCRKGDHLQGPKLGSFLTLRNELSEEAHVLTKQEILLGKGTRVERRSLREPRTALTCGSQSWVFMVMGLVSRWSLANHSNSESFLVAHPSLSQDGC